MTIISRATLCGAFAAFAMLTGAMHGTAEAALGHNALVGNALVGNALVGNALAASGARNEAATPGVRALEDLNGVAVEGVVLPMDAHR